MKFLISWIYRNKTMAGIMLLSFVVVGLAFYHQATEVPDNNIYTTQRLKKDSHGDSFKCSTFDNTRHRVDAITGYGLYITQNKGGSYSHGRGQAVVALDVHIGQQKLENSGSLLIAYDDSLHEELEDSFNERLMEYQSRRKGPRMDDTSYINELAKTLTGSNLNSKQLLLLRTQDGAPAMAFVGYHIRSYYTRIEDSQVFKVDGNLVFMMHGAYTLYDLGLLRK